MIPRHFVSHRIVATVLLLGASMTGCTKEEYDEAYYAKAHTVTLLPKETKDPKATSPIPPYYHLQVAQGYLSSSVTQHSSLVIEALYPTMEHFTKTRREAWYTKTPKGEWGQHVKDVLRIFLEYGVTAENDEGASRFRFVERQRDEKYLEIIPARKELAQKIPTLRVYQGRQNAFGAHYVFRQADGRTVVVKCDSICTGHTTWKSKLKIHYHFPEARLPEMTEVDLAVNRLIDSFQPTLITQQGR